MSQQSQWPSDWASTTLTVGQSACTILHYGAHIVSCKLAGSDEIFWLSPQSDYEIGKPIRGGNPICWPNFGVNKNFSELPKHGIARLMLWDKIDEIITKTVSSVVFALPSEQLQKWGIPSGISLKYTVVLEEGHLQAFLQTLNEGSESFSFTECQHSYFNISDINNIFLQGLDGFTYVDRLANCEKTHQGSQFHITGPTDIIVKNGDTEVCLVDPVKQRKISINKTHGRTTVVWNPYQAMPPEIQDMASDAFHQFVCIEPTNVEEYATKVMPKSGSLLGMNLTVTKYNK